MMHYNKSISASSKITLREITAKTVLEICSLSAMLSEPQKQMVAPNAVSIAQAHFTNQAWFRAIYADEGVFKFSLEPEAPQKTHNTDKTCNTADFEYPYGANP